MTADLNKPILCVDFDGVIHSYSSGWKGHDVVTDPPTPGALRWLWKATEWFDVQVYSSRSKEPGGVEAMFLWMTKWSNEEFGEQHPMGCPTGGSIDMDAYPITFARQKPAAFLTIDDRAICFEGDWDDLDAADLLNFKPWNKRPAVHMTVSEIEAHIGEHGSRSLSLNTDGTVKLGATGRHPQGVLNSDDEGELQMAVAFDPLDGLVHVEFGKPVAWLALPPENAVALAKTLLKHASNGGPITLTIGGGDDR
jgi:hypothetical protein